MTTSWRSLVRLFGGSRRLIAVSVAIATAQTILLVPIALLVELAFDDLIPGRKETGLLGVGVAILALYLASSALGLWARSVSLRVTKEAITALRVDLLEKVYALPRSFFDLNEVAKLHGTIVQDSERIDQMANALVAQLLPTAVIAVGLSVAMLVLNPILFLLLALVAPLLLLGSVVIGRSVRRRTHNWREAFEVFDAQTLFALRAITLTKAHGVDSTEIAGRRRQLNELGLLGRTMAYMQTAYSLANGTVMAIGAVIVLVVGGRAVAAGSMTVGDLVSFFTLLALLRGQTPTMLTAIPVVISGMESLERVEGLLAVETVEPYRGRRRIEFTGSVRIESVSFSYPDGAPVISDLDLEIGAGERVAIVGPNGAGKSTLVSLLLGLYRPDEGRLYAEGIPYDDLDMSHLRAQVGAVLQDPILFSATIRENIAYAMPDVDEEALRRVAALAVVDEFAESLPAGYETEVGDEGVLLSGGQRQRVAIARAMLRGPALLILDEPTTYLDAQSAMALMAGLRDLDPAPSLLIVTHDPLIAAEADRIVELRDGRLQQQQEVSR